MELRKFLLFVYLDKKRLNFKTIKKDHALFNSLRSSLIKINCLIKILLFIEL
jgi:DNA-directed RNA polymerase subunit L